jgi:RNA methyltransferase, TrmH family
MYLQVSKNKLKYIISLQKKKIREDLGQFLAEGDKIVREVLADPAWKPALVLATADWCELHGSVCEAAGVELYQCSPEELRQASGLQTPNKALAVLSIPKENEINPPKDQEVALFLDCIQDPGNLGAILRIADWFGIGRVFRSPDTVDLYNPKVIQASMGAFLRVQSPSIKLADLKMRFPQWPSFGALLQGEALFSIDPIAPALLVIGNEGKGIANENLTFIDQAITISRHPHGGAESLNAAVACGIICAAWRRI